MGPISYSDIDAPKIESLTGGQRPSCWISFVPAGGIVVCPEGSAQCTCSYAIQGSVVLYPTNAQVEPGAR
jgi:hypothetical protein